MKTIMQKKKWSNIAPQEFRYAAKKKHQTPNTKKKKKTFQTTL
jgi:hypothetical protein